MATPIRRSERRSLRRHPHSGGGAHPHPSRPVRRPRRRVIARPTPGPARALGATQGSTRSASNPGPTPLRPAPTHRATAGPRRGRPSSATVHRRQPTRLCPRSGEATDGDAGIGRHTVREEPHDGNSLSWRARFSSWKRIWPPRRRYGRGAGHASGGEGRGHLNVRVRRDADGDLGGHGHPQRIPAFASHGESSHGRAGHDRGTRLRAADLLRDTERTGTGSSRWSSRTSKRARSAHPEAGRRIRPSDRPARHGTAEPAGSAVWSSRSR